MKKLKCPKCLSELIHYINGNSYGFGEGYPYESGYYCPKMCGSWSDLQINDLIKENQNG